ncbi:hypothetical protein Q3G72_019613 [Acer saccharum]|nr:hypothetical protein Q3G72_019613 [Acer saccharum]
MFQALCFSWFEESVFPFQTLNTKSHSPAPTTIESWDLPTITVNLPSPRHSTPSSVVSTPDLPPSIDSSTTIQADVHRVSTPQDTAVPDSHPTTATTPTESPTVPANTPLTVDLSPESAPPVLSTSSSTTQHHMITRGKNNIHKPIQRLNLHTQLHHSTDCEPTTAA